MLAALSVCGVVQNVAHAQGGVLLPEPATAPVVRIVPHVVEYPAKKIESTEAPMPVPHPRPVAATGHIVHVQNVKNTNVFPAPSIPVPVQRAPMGMGGFVTPRPAIEGRPMVGEPVMTMPTASNSDSK